MWYLVGARWSFKVLWLVRSWRDYHGERDIEMRTLRHNLLSQRGQRGDVGLMTLVLGHHTLLWRLPEWILRTYAIVQRRCYRMCRRACGLASRMRVSWSSVWGFRRHGRM
jgi:hypothetical protein